MLSLEEAIMVRRELLGYMGIGAAGLLATGPAGAVAGGKERDEGHASEHAKTIGRCALACNEAAHFSLEHLKKEGSEEREHHAKAHELATDCQAFCTLAATLTARSSPLAQYAHQACAEACRCCADECEKGHGEVMENCARMCRECSELCRRMSKSPGAGEKPVGSP
jgi:hypothetical protein